eukprot:7315277-Lingulodinium_polyedra.AAC.1
MAAATPANPRSIAPGLAPGRGPTLEPSVRYIGMRAHTPGLLAELLAPSKRTRNVPKNFLALP